MDLIKIDVEGMELDVLEGARETIVRCKPVMVVEIIRTDAAVVNALLKKWGYQIFPLDINVLAVDDSDPTLSMLSLNDGNLNLNLRR